MSELAASPAAKAALKETDEGIGAWLSGLITGKGDSPSHAIVTAVLGVVPGLGQVMDARDAILDIVTLTDEPDNTWAWVGLTITLIGFIPVFGDGIKCTFKLARSGHAFPRLLDLLPNKYRGDIVRWIKEMDFAKIAVQVKEIGGKIITGFMGALDSWVMRRVVLDSKTVKRYLEQLEGLKRRLSGQIDNAMTELRKMRDRMLKDAEPPSTHRPDVAGTLPKAPGTAAAPPPAAAAPKTSPAAAAPKTSPSSTLKSPESAPKAGAGSKPDGCQVPPPILPLPMPPPVPPVPPRNPADIPGKMEKNPGRSDSTHTDTTADAKAKPRRKNDGVLGEHLTDYYMLYQYRYEKINDHGKLVEHVGAPKGNGIDHIWFLGNPALPQAYLVGDTKSTISEKIKLLSLLPEYVASKIKGLKDQPEDYKGVKLEGPSSKDGATTEKKAKNVLGDTKDDGVQMSHKWIVRKAESAKIVAGHKVEFMRKIDEFWQEVAKLSDTYRPTAPYNREIFTVNTYQMDMHENNPALHTSNPEQVHKIAAGIELMNDCLWE